MRGCLRYGLLLLFAVLVAIAVSLAVLTLQDRGLLPWLEAGYRNRAVVVLDSVQDMSVLTTTRYNYSTLVTSEREMPEILRGLYGERQALVAVGTITAGIDLQQMTEADIWTVGSTLHMRLPPPMLLDCFLDESASFVLERDTGLFAQGAPDLEGQARRFAIEQFRQGALERGILQQVQEQATAAITRFVDALNIPDIETITVITTPPDPNAPLPPSCL